MTPSNKSAWRRACRSLTPTPNSRTGASGCRAFHSSSRAFDAAATTAAELTKQLLAFARKQRLNPRPIDLNDAIVGMNDLLRPAMYEAWHGIVPVGAADLL